MKIITLIALVFVALTSMAQTSEELVPKDAASVFSINNISLFQKISLDDLVKYEFMEEIQQELFDGANEGKTLKDSGFDFSQKFNVFYGNGDDYEVSGFTFGIENKELLFTVFDDYQKTGSAYDGVEFYDSYFNRLAIKGNIGILYRVSPNDQLVNETTDSIWYANGNDYPWSDNTYNFDNTIEVTEEVEEAFFDEMETEENTSNPVETELPQAGADPTKKTYYEYRDSVELNLQREFLKKVNYELFVEGKNLLRADPRFGAQLSKTAEGTFYIDNSRTIRKDYDLKSLHLHYPGLYNDLYNLYKDNLIVGELVIKDHSIEMKMDANYGAELGSIYEELTDAKLDKNFLKYIHKDNDAFGTYLINLRAAYEKAHDVLIPILEKEAEKSNDVAQTLLLLEVMDEFLNKDAIFDTYKGGMFVSYNGIQKVKTNKVIFKYDEDTFAYTEEEVEAEEDMPIFTMGFSTEREELAQRLMSRVTRITSSWKQKENYIEIENGMLNAAPLFIVVKNGLFIITNDSDLVLNNINGYGANALDSKMKKSILKSGVGYAYVDLGKAIEGIPKSFFSASENRLLDVTRGKTGSIELTSSGTNASKTTFNLVYNFEGEYDQSGTYILDLINSLYVIAK